MLGQHALRNWFLTCLSFVRSAGRASCKGRRRSGSRQTVRVTLFKAICRIDMKSPAVAMPLTNSPQRIGRNRNLGGKTRGLYVSLIRSGTSLRPYWEIGKEAVEWPHAQPRRARRQRGDGRDAVPPWFHAPYPNDKVSPRSPGKGTGNSLRASLCLSYFGSDRRDENRSFNKSSDAESKSILRPLCSSQIEC
jgi:hypothetical protein